jgi:hypothetical protein
MPSALIPNAHGYPAFTLGRIAGTPEVRLFRSSRTRNSSPSRIQRPRWIETELSHACCSIITDGMDYTFILFLPKGGWRISHPKWLLLRMALSPNRISLYRDKVATLLQKLFYIFRSHPAFFRIIQVFETVDHPAHIQKIICASNLV